MDANSLEFHMAVADFIIAARTAVKNAKAGEKREFICPFCNEKVTATLRKHGQEKSVSAKCKQCGINLFS